MSLSIESLTSVMGGLKVFSPPLTNKIDLINNIRTGLPTSAIDALMKQFNLTAEELVNPLGVSISTIKRRHQQPKLSSAVSDRLIRLAKIIALATDILGSRNKATRWLHKPNRTLTGESPLSRLDTAIGMSQVEEILYRLEHGLFS